MGTRILLLLLLTWIMRLQATLFYRASTSDISGRDLILIGGGLFLLAKSTLEIHESSRGRGGAPRAGSSKHAGFVSVIIQIALIDIVFSLDSVITAVGLADDVAVMIIAIMIAVGVMMFAAGAIGRFVDNHPTIKMLALSFLVLIGVALIAEGIDVHIPKGYIYFAMAFSVLVEMLNIRIRGGAQAGAVAEERRLDGDAVFGGRPTPGESMSGAEIAYLVARVLDVRHLGRRGRCTRPRTTGPTSTRWGTSACRCRGSCCRSC